ncbi:MAG: hypothetical protein U0869_22675 [Chloroflexota bacterium]
MRTVRRSWFVAATILALGAAVAPPAVAQQPPPGLTDAAALEWSRLLPLPAHTLAGMVATPDGLVAVGGDTNGITSRARAWWSPDGTTWTRTLDDGRNAGYTSIDEVVATADGLIGIGGDGVMRCTGGGGEGSITRCKPIPVAIWRSPDGQAWERLDAGDAFAGATVSHVASGPLGLLATGTDQAGVPMTWRSADGIAWTAARFSGKGAASAQVMDLAATPGGWVMVGATGAHEVPRGGVGTPNGSKGAAWTSTHGETWARAAVEGRGKQVELRRVFVGRDGLIATGALDGGHVGAAWTSTDGTAWTLVPPTDGRLPEPWPVASDGTTIIGTAYGGAIDAPLTWSASTDGVAWRPLAATGETGTLPTWSGDGAADAAWLSGGRLLVQAEESRQPSFWVATPTADLPAASPSPSVDPSIAANTGRPLTTDELVALVAATVDGPPIAAVADVTILRDLRRLGYGACDPSLGCTYGELVGADGTTVAMDVLATDAVASAFPDDRSPLTGTFAFTAAGGGLGLDGPFTATAGATYLTPITDEAIGAAESTPVGTLIAVDGWLEVLGWGVPCPQAPGAIGELGDDTPFSRCPGGWITATQQESHDTEQSISLTADAPAIPVQANAYADFAPGADLLSLPMTPVRGTYLLRRVANPESGATPVAGWQVIGRLDPVDPVDAPTS